MRILLTGGNGRLGKVLIPLLSRQHTIFYPSSSELDISNAEQVKDGIDRYFPDLTINLAAWTKKVEGKRENNPELTRMFEVNVKGTENIARSCVNLIHISSDYIFNGSKGNYKEDDTEYPEDPYGRSKLLAEQVIYHTSVKINPLKYTIIRTSFKENPWPYNNAFTDQFTSAEYTEWVAEEIGKYVSIWSNLKEVPPILHIAGKRKSMYDLAVTSRPNVEPSKRDISLFPYDTSLNTDLWGSIKGVK